jgi:hypothetical protein
MGWEGVMHSRWQRGFLRSRAIQPKKCEEGCPQRTNARMHALMCIQRRADPYACLGVAHMLQSRPLQPEASKNSARLVAWHAFAARGCQSSGVSDMCKLGSAQHEIVAPGGFSSLLQVAFRVSWSLQPRQFERAEGPALAIACMSE